MRESNIKGLGGQVYYWTNECESDVALVFCHGLTADHHLFDRQVEYFEDKFKLVAWDWPLHGKSRPYNDFSYERVAEDLKTILEVENIKQAVIIGQSAGGYIAQAYYERYPETVVGFIGIGTTPFGQAYYKASELFWIKHFAAIARLYSYKTYCKASAKSVAVNEETRISMHKTLEKLGKKDMLIAVKSVYDEFLRRHTEVRFHCPVLLTRGDHDKIGNVAKYNEAWAKKEGYPLTLIEQAGHNANHDNGDFFNGLVMTFMENLGA